METDLLTGRSFSAFSSFSMFSLLISLCKQVIICNTHMVMFFVSITFCSLAKACVIGISASTGRPFSPPIAFRVVARPNPGKKEKHSIQQGKCHKCAKWVAVEGIKDMESKVSDRLLFSGKQQALMGGLVGKRIVLVRLPSSFIENLDLNFSSLVCIVKVETCGCLSS